MGAGPFKAGFLREVGIPMDEHGSKISDNGEG